MEGQDNVVVVYCLVNYLLTTCLFGSWPGEFFCCIPRGLEMQCYSKENHYIVFTDFRFRSVSKYQSTRAGMIIFPYHFLEFTGESFLTSFCLY